MDFSGFDDWYDSFAKPGPDNAQLETLAKTLCSTLQNDAMPGLCSSQKIAPDSIDTTLVVSWKGISVRWFLDVFMASPPVCALVKFDCPMWFVRNHCIPRLLPRLDQGQSCCLIDAVDAIQPGGALVAEPTVFISYTGGYRLALFAELAKDLDEHFIWCDMFCVDQISWRQQSAEFKDSFMCRLQENVASIGRTVLLLNKWDRLMDALGMIWVLWEIFATVESKGHLDVLLSDAEHERFLVEGLGTTTGIRGIFESLADIDARQAIARDEEDTTRILRLIEEGKGVTHVNEQVIRCMRQWLVQNGAEVFADAIDVIDAETDGEDEEVDAIKMCHNMARLYAQFGDFSEAERLQRKVVAGFLRILGTDHCSTLVAQNALAGMLREQGKDLQEAEELYRSVLAKRRSLLGEESMETLISANNFGNCLVVQEKFSEAMAVYEQAYNALPPCEADEEEDWFVLRKGILSNLAVVFSRQNEFEAAFERFEEVRRVTERRFGPRHPESLRAVGNIASLLEGEGDTAEAEKLFRGNLTVQREIFGEENHQTLRTMHCLSRTLFKIGQYEEAETLSRKTVRGRQAVLGSDHEDTLESQELLQIVLAITNA